MYIETTIILVGNKEYQIQKYSKEGKLYCYLNDTLNPVNFNGGMGEELHGINLIKKGEKIREQREG